MKESLTSRGFIAPHPFGKLRAGSTDDESVRRMGHPTRVGGEEGYLLLMVVVLAALVLIALALAAPKMKARIQRDQEQDLRYRGMAYAHAIKLYYHKFNNYPTTINQMVNSNNMKFLRKKYSDPITGLKVWRPVYFGQVGWGGSTNPNCSTSASSFGGSPGNSGALGGGSPSLGGSNSGSLGGSSNPSGFGSSSSTAGCDPASQAAAAGGAAATGTPTGSLTGATNPDGTPATPATPPLNAQGLPVGTDPKNVPDPAGFLTPITSFGQTATGGGFSTGSLSSSSTSTVTSGGALGVAGGGQIVGVASLSRKESIMSVKGKNHYNDLEFVYDPTQDYGGTAGLTGTSIGASQQLSPTNNSQPPGFGSPFGGSSNPPGFGGTPAPNPPPTPAPPSNPSQ